MKLIKNNGFHLVAVSVVYLKLCFFIIIIIAFYLNKYTFYTISVYNNNYEYTFKNIYDTLIFDKDLPQSCLLLLVPCYPMI